MARELTAYAFAVTNMAIPATAASAALILPPAGSVSVCFGYASGGSLEIFRAPNGATATSVRTTDGVTLGSGYLLTTSERVQVDGAPSFYLAATGATAVASFRFGLSQGS